MTRGYFTQPQTLNNLCCSGVWSAKCTYLSTTGQGHEASKNITSSNIVSFHSVVLPGFPLLGFCVVCVFCRLLLPVCRAAVRRLASSPSLKLKVVRPGVLCDRQDGRQDVSLCCPYLKHCGYTCIQHAVLLSFLLGPRPNRTACAVDC